MKLKVFFLCFMFLVVSVHRPVGAACPEHPIVCAIWEKINEDITPLPTIDEALDNNANFVALQQVLQTIAATLEVIEYERKLEKLSESISSLSDNLKQVNVLELKNTVKGVETFVDAYKGTVPDVKTANVDFEKGDQVSNAITQTAVVANPVGNVEELAAQERKDAYIQQATIDLLSDLLVAKKKLSGLKQSDSQGQGSSSSEDTVGAIHVKIQMNDFENQVQALEHKIQAMRNVREGIRSLKNADTVKEEINVGGQS